MAFTHGKDAAFLIDDTAGVLTDISAFVDNVSFPQTLEPGETTTYGKESKTYIVGLQDATISISGKWDGAAGAIDAIMVGGPEPATRTFEYGPEGSAVGSVKKTGECIRTSYDVSAPVADVVTFTAEFQVTGDVTQGVF